MIDPVRKVAALLFASGLCALVYQTVWLRELRLIFGASTAASAAVLAIFMGGLGIGGLWLGRRTDRAPRPLQLYAHLELLVALAALLSYPLIWLTRALYVSLGGSTVLGAGGSTVLRLVLSALILALPTVLMGGTLPAAARAVETDSDTRRRNLAALYGANTLGAVTGALLSTFLLLEALGNRRTLLIAALLNLVVGVTARSLSRGLPTRATADEPPAPDALPPAEGDPAPAAAPVAAAADPVPVAAPVAAAASATGLPPQGLVLAAAAIVGFAFLLMELVWYRMLAPLLSGSSFTFGLILAIALLGIGIGGVLYSLLQDRGPRSASLTGLAWTCALEAVFLIIPFALGDRLAILSILLRTLSGLGFAGHVAAWSIITSIVVLPAAVIAGWQFPLLISLLGRGGHSVGRQVGLAYAWNTAGSIAGSLAGGFGLIPLLSAPGCWRLTTVLLAGLAVVTGLWDRLRTPGSAPSSRGPLLCAALSVLLLFSVGPTAAWRHSGISIGRGDDLWGKLRNDRAAWVTNQRRNVVWSRDGVESNLALADAAGYTFIVNGKSDGHALGDSGTQVMGGLIGGALHPAAREILVIGLGTGSTTGWLAALPETERVDVVEIEPAIDDVARACAPVNQNALGNPKVHLVHNDAREVLLTTPRRYDLIFSEPSNPYRAGIASLFTSDFYRSAAARMKDGGIFAQWVQGYDVESATVRTIFATLASVFPAVEVWETQTGDLVLLGTMAPLQVDAARLRQRLGAEPLRSALAVAWRTEGLEGFLSHFITRNALIREVARQAGEDLNTDDMNLVEFGFARSVGRGGRFSNNDLWQVSGQRGEDRPLVQGAVDWDLFEDERVSMFAGTGRVAPREGSAALPVRTRAMVQRLHAQGRLTEALAAWRKQEREPRTLLERTVLAESLAEAGDAAALPLIEVHAALHPLEAELFRARLHWRSKQPNEARAAMTRAILRLRTDPWPRIGVVARALTLVPEMAGTDQESLRAFYTLLREPFAVHAHQDERILTLVELARRLPLAERCADAWSLLEPNVPVEERLLSMRLLCYKTVGHPLLGEAEDDLAAFHDAAPVPFQEGLLPEKAARTRPARPATAPEGAPQGAPLGAAPQGAPQAAPLGTPQAAPQEPAATPLAKPAPAQPAPTQPAPIKPAPAQPAPIKPAPIQPAPIQPAPTKPAAP